MHVEGFLGHRRGQLGVADLRAQDPDTAVSLGDELGCLLDRAAVRGEDVGDRVRRP